MLDIYIYVKIFNMILFLVFQHLVAVVQNIQVWRLPVINLDKANGGRKMGLYVLNLGSSLVYMDSIFCFKLMESW